MNLANRKFGLDLARAIAISLVVVDHFFKKLSILGWYGVDLFFVLSGFLIGGILLKTISQNPSFPFKALKEFWVRRWFRTLPNYFLFLILNLIAGFLLLRPMGEHIWKYLIFSQNLAWPQPLFFGESWSLAVEEWFYLLFAFSLFIFNFVLTKTKYKSSLFKFVTTLFLILPLVLRFIFNPGADWRQDMGRIVIFRLDALMYGVTLAYLHRAMPVLWGKFKGLFYPGIALIIFSIYVEGKGVPKQFLKWMPATLLTLIPLGFAFILPRLEQLPQLSGWGAGVIQKISLWSYSIYLSHILIFIPIRNYFESYFSGIIPIFLFRLGIVALVVLFSAMIYQYYEKPMTDLRERFSKT